MPHVEQIDEFVFRGFELGGLDAIDFLVQPKRFLRRQIPPQLIFLPHHQREPAAISVFAQPGHETHHSRRAAAGGDDAGKQFKRRRFARAVGAEKGDEFALLNRQIDARYRMHFAVLAMKQSANRSRQTFALLINTIGLRQPFNFDNSHSARIIRPRAACRQAKNNRRSLPFVREYDMITIRLEEFP